MYYEQIKTYIYVGIYNMLIFVGTIIMLKTEKTYQQL